MQRHRSWCFTVNNYSSEDEHQLQTQECRAKFLVYGREKAPGTGTPHLQGYIQMKNSQTLLYMKEHVHATAHWEPAKGKPIDNWNYCTKDQDYFHFGEVPKQGKRSDIQTAKQIISEGGSLLQVAEETNSYQALKHAELYLKLKEKARNQQVTVYWFYGPTGVGKTKEASQMCPNAYWHPGGKWWEGYDGEKEVIIDDFRQEDWSITTLLKMWQPYPFRVETKGGSRQCQATTFIVTCPMHPMDLRYPGEDLEQVLRRIKEIRQFHR